MSNSCDLCGHESKYRLDSIRWGRKYICQDCANQYGSPEKAAAEAARREQEEKRREDKE